MKKISALVLSGMTVLTLSACGTKFSAYTDDYLETRNAHYWQRTEASSAIYQRGPKAQEMLHRDIAHCTYEVRELQRLGTLRTLVPGDADMNGKAANPNSAAGRLAAIDTPDRDGFLYAEQSDFHDFETCMKSAGWERVEYLPYRLATEARDDYIDAIKAHKRVSKTPKPEPVEPAEQEDFKDLNK